MTRTLVLIGLAVFNGRHPACAQLSLAQWPAICQSPESPQTVGTDEEDRNTASLFALSALLCPLRCLDPRGGRPYLSAERIRPAPSGGGISRHPTLSAVGSSIRAAGAYCRLTGER